MPLEAGSLLHDRYRLRRVLNHTGHSALYLATDEAQAGALCAIQAHAALTPEAERVFRRDAGLLISQRHPNLPRVIQHFVQGTEHYLVLDYVEGEDLQQRLARDDPLPEAQVLAWAAPMCEAVRYLHSLVPPILHRDLKPANFRLTAEGQLVLVGFGVPRPPPADPRNAGGVVGLATGFAAPEVYGLGRIDARSDQYALAATLYTLLLGQPPPDSVARLLGQIRLSLPREVQPGLSERTAAALVRGLEVRPEDRFPDTLAFTRALLDLPPDERPAEMTVVAPSRRPAPEPEPEPAASDEMRVARRRAAPAGDATNVAHAPAAAPRPAPASAAPPRGPVSPLPARPTAQPRKRGPLYVVFGLVLLILAAAAIALGAAGGVYLGGRLRPSPTASPTAVTPPPLVTSTLPAAAVAPTGTPAPTRTSRPTDPATATATPTLEPTAAGTPLGSGGRLAFISNRDGQHFQIYTMNPDGTGVRPVTSDPTDKWDPNWTFGGTQLAWSPDGTRLLYVAAAPDGSGTDLWLINADGSGAPVNLTAAPGDDIHPAWCADGSLWFTSLRANNTPQIFTTTLAEAEGGQRPRNISGTHHYPREYDPVLLPDGNCQRLMFVTTVGGIRPQIWRYFLDCANCYRVVRTEQAPDGAAEEPALSADGVYLAYTRRVGETAEIMVGEVLNRLVNAALTDSLANFQPQFSPDGQWLVFTSERDGNREIYTMTATGASQTNLTAHPATDTDPVWQPAAVP